MAIPICPPDCNAPLPEVSFTDCNPPIHLSEIEWIMFAKPGAAAIADPLTQAGWNARINNEGNSADAIRLLRVIGNMPAPTENVVVISGQRRIVIDRTFTVEFDVDEMSDKNYEAFRELQCGGELLFWFVTRSGHYFGGTTGQKVSLTGATILDRGENAFQRIAGTATWKSKFSPERAVWPLYGATSSEQLAYDSVISHAAATDVDGEGGVSTVVPAIDADLKFEYNEISPRTGAAQTMVIKLGAVTLITVDYTADYNGRSWKFTAADGTVYSGTFYNGNVVF
jgi:hypothetical protein